MRAVRVLTERAGTAGDGTSGRRWDRPRVTSMATSAAAATATMPSPMGHQSRPPPGPAGAETGTSMAFDSSRSPPGHTTVSPTVSPSGTSMRAV